MTTLFVNQLTVIDFAYLDPDLGLVGESWQVDIELDGTLDQQGMVLDFGEIKQTVKRCIDREFDHKLLLPGDYQGIQVEELDGQLEVGFILGSGERLRHKGPASATAIIPGGSVDEERLSQAIIGRLEPLLPENVETLRLRLHPEQSGHAWYRYSHGLRQHHGNCQRIAHGHRSQIHIHRDGKPDPGLEGAWAEQWRDIYIGTRSDLETRFEQGGSTFYRFAYQARQGRFELELPASHCYLVEQESTVENLAQHIAAQLKARYPDSRFRVVAFEGVGKGSVATA